MLHRIILGPQRPIANFHKAVETAVTGDSPVAVISAGWQEAESEIKELQQSIRQPLINLNLYARAEDLFHSDSSLHEAYRHRQEQLQQLQNLYQARLHQLMIAARRLRRMKQGGKLLTTELLHAIEQIRELDRHLMLQIELVYAEYEQSLAAIGSSKLTHHIDEISKVIQSCSTVIVTGGNALVLLNRLQLFRMRELLASRSLVAWSAGAMVLADKVVLYHDKTPLGRREPEVLGPGLGIVPDYVFLMDANKRLQQDDHVRLSLFNARFAPATCLTLNSGSMLHLERNRVSATKSVGYLTDAGENRALQH